MNISEVKELLAAGFTAEEIRKMEAPAEPEVTISDSAPVLDAESGETKTYAEIKTEDKKDDAAKISDAISAAISESFKPFEDLYQKLSKLAGMPSMADVKPKGIEDIISNFFKEE